MNMRPQLVIDLGSNTIKAASGSQLISMPSQIIRNVQTGRTVCVGEEAASREPDLPNERIFAVKDGKLSDYQATQRIIAEAMSRLLSWWALLRPKVLVAVNSRSTKAETKQLKTASQIAGAQSVYAARSIVLAALGAGIDPADSHGRMMLDVGAGKTEVAVIVRGSVTASKTIGVGGNRLVQAVVAHIEDAYGYSLPKDQAETILQRIGTAVPQDNPATITPSGQSHQGLTVSANDIAAAIADPLQEITDCVHGLMQNISAALLSDISTSGITLVGGVADLSHIDTYFARRLSVPTQVTDTPADVIASGGVKAWSRITQHPQYPQLVTFQ